MKKTYIIMFLITLIVFSGSNNLYAQERRETILEQIERGRLQAVEQLERNRYVDEKETSNTEHVTEQYQEQRLTEEVNVRTVVENTLRTGAMLVFPLTLAISLIVCMLSYLFMQTKWQEVSMKVITLSLVGMFLIYFAFPIAIFLIERIG